MQDVVTGGMGARPSRRPVWYNDDPAFRLTGDGDVAASCLSHTDLLVSGYPRGNEALGGAANVATFDVGKGRTTVVGGEVDTVVSTLVMCTADAPDLALREVRRVLRPGGRLLFLEHVRSGSPRLAAWQDRLAGPWRRFADGCHCNRATEDLIRGCGLKVDYLHQASWRGMPPIVRPLITGMARKDDSREPPAAPPRAP
ncbi:class I SAM-dependent methyltransferase [Streptomyces mexicanus]|uniref:class I SAM-dependent methyltransferase n=1 Tax=Streptomyces mexicanus TaxID=178566 RepID=UPI0036A46CE8